MGFDVFFLEVLKTELRYLQPYKGPRGLKRLCDFDGIINSFFEWFVYVCLKKCGNARKKHATQYIAPRIVNFCCKLVRFSDELPAHWERRRKAGKPRRQSIIRRVLIPLAKKTFSGGPALHSTSTYWPR